MQTDRGLSGPHLARLLGAWRTSRPAYAALAAGVRLLVLDGRLPLGTRVPGERELAAALGLSRTTAAAAYDELRREGFLASRRGAGSWVQLPATRLAARAPAGAPAELDLSCAATSAPDGALHAALAAATAELARHLPGHGMHVAGLPVLREAVATHLTRRGAPTAPEQVLVTAGAQHGWVLLLRELVRAGDRVVVEHPSYPAALDAVRLASARPVPVPLLPEGWDLAMLEATLRQAAPRIVHTLADHHNPTGLTMPAADRERLVALARAGGATVVVDETMAGLDLDAAPAAPPLAALDPDADVVITLGSTSKAFWAGLRIGWIRASPALVARLARARAALDLASPVVEQLVATELLHHADELLAARRATLRARREALAGALARELPAWRFRLPAGGLVLWAALDEPRSSALAAEAERHGVRLAAGPRFGVAGGLERFVRLPFTLPEAELRDAAGRLATAWAAVRAGRSADAPTAGALVA